MLYCPKCQATYENGTQRFCTNEGVRLLPYPASSSTEESGKSPKGVFSSILSKSLPKKEGLTLPPLPSVEQTSRTSAFQPPTQSKFFKADKNAEPEPVAGEITREKDETSQQHDEPARKKSFEALPLARIINPSLIPEKQTESDKVFLKEAAPPARKESEISGGEPADILESFEAENEDFLEISENSGSFSADNFEALHKTEDVPFKLIDPPHTTDKFELNLEKPKNDFSGSDAEIKLDLGLDDTFEENPKFELDFEEPGKASSEIELEIDDLDYVSAVAEPSQKIELDLDEIDYVSMPEPFSASNAPDLEHLENIDTAERIPPNIELDLADLEEVSIPETPAKDRFSESIESKDEAKPASEESLIAPVPSLKQAEEKAGTPKVADNKEKSQVVADSAAAAAAAAGTSKIKATDAAAWEKRSIDTPGEEESRWFLYPLIGLVLLGLGLLGFFYLTNQNNPVNEGQSNTPTQNSGQTNTNTNSEANVSAPANETGSAPVSQDTNNFQPPPTAVYSDAPPPRRTINPPPETVYFKNEKKRQKGKLAEGFLGFSIYYPKTWKVIKRKDKFLDISLTTPDGALIKQLSIEPYDSNGTFQADKSLFKGLVEKSDKDLRGIFFRNYQVIYEGESTFQSGRWQVYEVRFQGISEDKNLTTWGRRLWIPVQKPGMKSGFIITMIGTSNSGDVKSVDNLGENDDLAEILKTFEPELD